MIRRSAPCPPVPAISVNVRHAAGIDATRPDRSRGSGVTRNSLITRAPPAIAQVRQHPPQSCTSIRTEDSARDSPGQTGPIGQVPQ